MAFTLPLASFMKQFFKGFKTTDILSDTKVAAFALKSIMAL